MSDIFAETKRPTLAQRNEQVETAKTNLKLAETALANARLSGNVRDIKFHIAFVDSSKKQLASVTAIRDRQAAES